MIIVWQDCPESLIEDLAPSFHIALAEEAAEEVPVGIWEQGMNLLAMFSAIANSVPCTNVYLRSAYEERNGFDFFELAVWGHFVLEQSQTYAIDSVGVRFWDDGVLNNEVQTYMAASSMQKAKLAMAANSSSAPPTEEEKARWDAQWKDHLKAQLAHVSASDWEAQKDLKKRIEELLGEPIPLPAV